jgi:hypothetical protein
VHDHHEQVEEKREKIDKGDVTQDDGIQHRFIIST